MQDLLRHVFGWVCGQNPAHTWTPGGELLPLCQRCTGVYTGALVAGMLHLSWRPVPTLNWRWLNGAFLLFMLPSGLYWIPQNPELRCGSGILFGFGLVAFLCLTLPGIYPDSRRRQEAQTKIGSQSEPLKECLMEAVGIEQLPTTEHAPITVQPAPSIPSGISTQRGVHAPYVGCYEPKDKNSRAQISAFIASLLATLVLVPLLAENGNVAAAGILMVACVGGALALVALLLANAFRLLRWLAWRVSARAA